MENPEPILEPLPYHFELRDYLKSEERELWNWFSSGQAKAAYAETLKLQLLKTTYRLDRESHPELYACLDVAKAQLGIELPVTLYQAQQTQQVNATLFHMPGQGHIVFSGPVLTLLNQDELKSVIGHELAHYILWERDGGEFHVADRLVHAAASDPRAEQCHEETARNYRLFTEIFADRGSLAVTRDPHPVIAGLVKVETGLSQVSAASYLKQAEEIFANGNVATEGVSHPEAFIRARALTLWQEKHAGANPEIQTMIEGNLTLDRTDVLSQKRMVRATRSLLHRLLRPKWFQTPMTLGHATQFFADFQPGIGTSAALPEELLTSDDKLREYFCYVLLDFARIDPELEEAPLAAALQLSAELKLDTHFEKIAAKELKMRARDMRRIKEQAPEITARAEAECERV